MAIDFGIVAMFVAMMVVIGILGWIFSRKTKSDDPVIMGEVVNPPNPNAINTGIIVVADDPVYKPDVVDPVPETDDLGNTPKPSNDKDAGKGKSKPVLKKAKRGIFKPSSPTKRR